jgi:Raf kinase inhibitor-like YbhB/YbcL family protein
MRFGSLRYAALALAGAALAGCGSSGEHAPEEASPRPLPPITVTSSAFGAGAPIPQKYACKDRGGENLSPPLAWTNVPSGATNLAVVVTDPDADDFIHWVLVDVPPAAMSFAEAQVPAGVRKVHEWMGPCPPSGVHHYVFTVYALRSTIPGDLTEPADVITAVRDAAVARGELIGTYAR